MSLRSLRLAPGVLGRRELGNLVAVRQIGWMEAAAMQRFGLSYEEARAWIQAKRARAGRLKRGKVEVRKPR